MFAATMSTDELPMLEAAVRFSRDDYLQMKRLGLVGYDTELLDGIVLQKRQPSELVAQIIDTLVDWLSFRTRDGFQLRQSEPLEAGQSELRPDIALIEGTSRAYRVTCPATAALVVELGSYEDIARRKTPVYAAAEVDEYWIVLPGENSVEVYSNPVCGEYTACVTYSVGETIHSDSLPELWLDVSRLFGMY